MTLVRRLALHAAWLAAVVAVTVALGLLAGAGLTALSRALAGDDAWPAVRSPLGAGIGVAIVAVPAWLLVRRALRRLLEQPGERESASHALAVTLLLSGTIIAAIQLGSFAVTFAGLAAFDETADGLSTYLDPTLAGAALAALLVWLLTALARVREVGRSRPAGAAAALTRLGLYGPAVLLLLTALSGLAQAATLWAAGLAPAAPSYDGAYETTWYVIAGVIPAIGAAAAFVPHGWYAHRLAGAGRPFAAEETTSLVRRAAWAVVALGALGYVTGGLSGLLAAGLHAWLGTPGTTLFGGATPGAEAVGAALGIPLPLLVALVGWRWHAGEVRRHVPDDPARAARTWTYAVAWVGLTAAAVGATQALALLGAWIVAPARVAIDGPEQAAGAVAPLVVGVAAWGVAWWLAGRRRAADPAEARSTARRAVLAASAASAFVVLLAGLSAAIVPAVLAILEGDTVGLLPQLTLPVSAALVATLVGGGALLAWRADDRLLAAVDTAGTEGDEDVPVIGDGSDDTPPTSPPVAEDAGTAVHDLDGDAGSPGDPR